MDEPLQTISFWQSLAESGPIIWILHLCMLFCFCASIVLAFRRTHPLLAFSLAIAPFVFGAFAMWLGIRAYISIFPSFFSGLYDGNPVKLLHQLQLPFLTGTGFSTVAFIVCFLARALLPKTRNA